MTQDVICTPTFDLETTAGSLALKGLNATEDAPIATLLREAGCIVIGKSNLSVSGQIGRNLFNRHHEFDMV
jgi:amidase